MTSTRNWDYLLDQVCAVAGISHAAAVSADGLKIAKSRELDEDRADHLSGITSGLASLTNGAASLMNAGPVEHIVVDMAGGYLIVMAIDERSILTVLAAKTCNLGHVTFEMASLIQRSGAILTPDVRWPQHT